MKHKTKFFLKWLVVWLFSTFILLFFAGRLVFSIIDNFDVPNCLYEYDGFNDKQPTTWFFFSVWLAVILFVSLLIYLIAKRKHNKNLKINSR